MKHYIIAKFKDREDTEKLLPEIKALFQKTLDLKRVGNVRQFTNQFIDK